MKTIQVKEFRIKQSKSPSPTKTTPKIENAINTKTLTTLRRVKERKKTINQENQTTNDEPNDNMINLIEIYEKSLFKGSNFKNNEYENYEDNQTNDNYLKDFYTKYEEKEINFSIFKNKINKNQTENELFLIKRLLNKYTDKMTNYSNINGDQFLNANKLKRIYNNLNNSKGASKNKDLERIKLNWKLQKQFLMTKKDVLKFSNPNNKIGVYDKNKTIDLELNTDFIEENIKEEKNIDKNIEKLVSMTFLKIKSEKSYFLKNLNLFFQDYLKERKNQKEIIDKKINKFKENSHLNDKFSHLIENCKTSKEKEIKMMCANLENFSEIIDKKLKFYHTKYLK